MKSKLRQRRARRAELPIGADRQQFPRVGSSVVPDHDVRRARAAGALKEVVTLVRPRMAGPTKEELLKQGFPSVTWMPVLGRGRQGGLAYPQAGTARVPYLPKCMLVLVIQDRDVGRAIAAIVRVNRTGEIGDGRIFVTPVGDVRRVRTGERGAEAVRC